MKQEQTESDSTIQITLETHEILIMERSISKLVAYRNTTRNEIMAHALLHGILLALQALTASVAREPIVQEAIRKLKLEEPISTEEIDAIWFAAQEGHLEAKIVMEDFKRFGRSIAKE